MPRRSKLAPLLKVVTVRVPKGTATPPSSGAENTKPPRFEVQLICRESSTTYSPRTITTSQDVADLLSEEMVRRDRECMYVIFLDTRNAVIGVELAGLGTLSASLVHPREIFKAAILVNAASIIILHNHPSGDPAPSQEDKDLTKRMSKAGELLGIELLDHVIVAPKRHCSLRETFSDKEGLFCGRN